MKKSMTLIMALISFAITFGQNEYFNYKAVIKDGNGEIVAIQSISVKLTIIKTENETDTPVFSETHAVTTDANGLIMLDIGSGVPNLGSFSMIEWRSDTIMESDTVIGDYLFPMQLQVEVDINGGSSYVDLGATYFKTVPYALNVLEHGLIRKGNGWMLDTSHNFLDHGVVSPGYYAIDMTEHFEADVGSTGASGDGSFAAGLDNYSAGYGSVSFGCGNYAVGAGSAVFGVFNYVEGSYSLVNGHYNEAYGGSSFVLGEYNDVDGSFSFVHGNDNDTYANYALAHGSQNEALGEYGTALGKALKADALHATTIGRYNIGGGNPSTWIETDPIFEIGNGADDANRSNAITVLKNGYTGIGISSPVNPLSVLDVTVSNTVRIESLAQTVGKDLMELVVPTGTGATSQFIEMQQGTSVVAAINTDGSAEFSSVTTDSGTFRNVNVGRISNDSDRRLKRDIEDLSIGLKEVMQLQPKAYFWKESKRNGEHKSIGLIAQELKPVIENVVIENDKENKTLSVNYIELIPVLVNAIKQQQELIQEQKGKIENLSARLDVLDNN